MELDENLAKQVSKKKLERTHSHSNLENFKMIHSSSNHETTPLFIEDAGTTYIGLR